MPYVGRGAWQSPANPVTGPRPTGRERELVFHWPGSTSVPTTLPATLDTLRAMQADYTANRGYSLGYNWAISRDGYWIEIRGRDYRNAANLGRKVNGNANEWTSSVLMFCGTSKNTTVTGAQEWAVHELVRAHYWRWPQRVHADLDPTSCAGPTVIAAVRAGTFRPEPVPIPPPGDDKVIKAITHQDHPAVYLTDGMTKSYVRGQQAMAEVRKRLRISNADVLGPAEFNSYGPIVGPRPDGVDEWGAPDGNKSYSDEW